MMAYLKDIPTHFGFGAYYWKIVQININVLERTARVELAGFISEAARRGYPSTRPIADRAYDFGPHNFPFSGTGNILREAYTAIKNYEDSEFTDAQSDVTD